MVNVIELSNEMLATNVVIYRTLSINKELAIQSMAELAKRREKGMDFNYEDFIDSKIKEMPKPNTDEFKKMTKGLDLFKMLIK